MGRRRRPPCKFLFSSLPRCPGSVNECQPNTCDSCFVQHITHILSRDITGKVICPEENCARLLTQKTIHSALHKFHHDELLASYLSRHNWYGTSDEWIKRFSKKCPQCQVPIEKNGGCSNMKCTQCSLNFQWHLIVTVEEARDNMNPFGANHFGGGFPPQYPGPFPQQDFGQYGGNQGYYNAPAPFPPGNVYPNGSPFAPPAAYPLPPAYAPTPAYPPPPPPSLAGQFAQPPAFPPAPAYPVASVGPQYPQPPGYPPARSNYGFQQPPYNPAYNQAKPQQPAAPQQPPQPSAPQSSAVPYGSVPYGQPRSQSNRRQTEARRRSTSHRRRRSPSSSSSSSSGSTYDPHNQGQAYNGYNNPYVNVQPYPNMAPISAAQNGSPMIPPRPPIW
ncbi:unnamed protein product [Adineta ricciae]|uniref:RBR-type E3 ubiquitin transferase n=1 Tax=Adineta ricciae TaxID=249248 RepID=A0A814ZGX4_ADIRI|nr:unnamed protein product [Adineta ricciae]